jgi:hypothetical protein
MYPEPPTEFKRDSRWKVFWSTTLELFRHYGPLVFAICIVLFGIVSVRNHGFTLEALIDTLLYAVAISFGVLILCAGFGLQAATFWYRKKHDD